MIAKQPQLTITDQCRLLDISRSSAYFVPQGPSLEDLALMRKIDEIYTKWPFYGSRRIRECLGREGQHVGRGRIRRLMRLMGLEAIFPKPRTSVPKNEHKKYPYLLRGLTLTHPQQVWASDITYIRLESGFVYLVAVLDWFSRYVLSWRLSNSMSVEFCLEALEDALKLGKPEIFNTDQGSQFTSCEFVGMLEKSGVRVSMDGRGRCFDNIFTERLWRSVKYEEIYLHEYEGMWEAFKGIERYFDFYNNERPHQSLKYRYPKEVHFGIC